MANRIFDSSTQTEPLTLVAPYYNAILPETVFFPREEVSVSVDSLGHIVFSDRDGQLLDAVDLPVHPDPSQYAHTAQYGNMRLSADGENVTVFLPVYSWTDHYPHCDGESDRWSRHICRWFRVVFHCPTRQIAILDR